MHPRPANRFRPTAHRATLAIAAVAVAVLPLAGQTPRLNLIKNFKIIERFSPSELGPGRTNQVKTYLSGAEAEQPLRGPTFVKQMRIDNLREDGRTNLIARAPQSWFDFEDRVAWSTGRLDVASADGRFQISGWSGFTCWLTNTHVVLSNRVRTVIHRELVEAHTP